MPTRKEMGLGEPGFEAFAKFYRRGGAGEETIAQYAEFVGTVRALSERPCLARPLEMVETRRQRVDDLT